VRTLTSHHGRYDGDTETFPLAFHATQDPIWGSEVPALSRGHDCHGNATAGVMADAHPRRLTPTECERLQGFPDGWTDLGPKTPDSRRYAALGDAVTVPVAEWIGRRLHG
jgi:site-specific DNA-cytosine methylase